MQRILNNVQLGKNIRAVRMGKRLTQADTIARMQLMGSTMSRSTLANIEAGRRNIKADDLRILKEIFEVEYDEFFKV